MNFKKSVTISLVVSFLLISSILFSGCALLLIGGATGAYIHGRQIENEEKTEAPLK